MKKIQMVSILIIYAVISTLINFAWNPSPVGAAEKCNIVSIVRQNMLNIPNITVSKGDCVVWINWSKQKEVIISFHPDEQCIIPTVPNDSFHPQKADGCFISEALSYGKTTSLVFVNPGTYKYKVISPDDGSVDGKVIVSE